MCHLHPQNHQKHSNTLLWVPIIETCFLWMKTYVSPIIVFGASGMWVFEEGHHLSKNKILATGFLFVSILRRHAAACWARFSYIRQIQVLQEGNHVKAENGRPFNSCPESFECISLCSSNLRKANSFSLFAIGTSRSNSVEFSSDSEPYSSQLMKHLKKNAWIGLKISRYHKS